MIYMGLTQKHIVLDEKTLQNVAFVTVLRKITALTGPTTNDLVFKERVAGARKKSEPSTISASVARFWGAKCVFSGIYGGTGIFADFYDVRWIADGTHVRCRLLSDVGGRGIDKEAAAPAGFATAEGRTCYGYLGACLWSQLSWTQTQVDCVHSLAQVVEQ